MHKKPNKAMVATAAPLKRGGRNVTYFEITSSPMAKKFEDAIRVRGKDYLGPVTVGPNEDYGQCYSNLFISPEEFFGTRLEAFGKLYEKFLFRRLKIHFQPAQPTTQQGSYILAYDRDISDPTPPLGQQGVREYLSFKDSIAQSIWEHAEIDCRLDSPETGFYTNSANQGDERLAYQGQVYVACMAKTGLGSGVILGDLWIDYEVDLFVPQLSNPIQSLAQAVSGVALPADALAGFVGKAATKASQKQWIPKSIPGLAANAIELAEGLYRVSTVLTQGIAGNITLAPPVLTLKDPAPASFPPSGTTTNTWMKSVNNIAANAIGDLAIGDYLVDVPRGGGYLTQALTTSTGLDGVSRNVFLDIIKMGGYLNNLDSIL